MGHDVVILDVARDVWRQSLREAGVPALQTDGPVEMFDIYKQPEAPGSPEASKLTGHAPRTLAEFLAAELTLALQTTS